MKRAVILLVVAVAATAQAKPVATLSNRNVFVAAYGLKDGRTGVFALNLHSSPQTTVVTLPSGATHEFRLGAMEVGYAACCGSAGAGK